MKRHLLLLLASATLPELSAAQYRDHDHTTYAEFTPTTPAVNLVVLRGDSTYFMDVLEPSRATYAFDRRTRRFARVAPPSEIPDPLTFGGHFENAEDHVLVDSIKLARVVIDDDRSTHVIRVGAKRTIGLRGVRIAAERRWRKSRGLPEPQSDDSRYAATDWPAITVSSYAVDAGAVWLGLAAWDAQEFTLGGLLRVDRRTLRVEFVEDSVMRLSSVLQIVPDGKKGYYLLAGGRIRRFNPSTRRSTPGPVNVGAVNRFALANDTLFVAGTHAVAVGDVRSGSVQSQEFQLAVEGDSIVYALADSAVEPSLHFQAALGVARRFRIAPLGPWMRAAVDKVEPVGIQYNMPGDRTQVSVDIDSTGTPVGESTYSEEHLGGPLGIYVDGLTHPTLLPFLRAALNGVPEASRHEIAHILARASDTTAIPHIRMALDSVQYTYKAPIATALTALGDSAGFRWIRRALVDTVQEFQRSDPSLKIVSSVFHAAAAARDPANVPTLLRLLVDPRYSLEVADVLLNYQSARVLDQGLHAAERAGDVLPLRAMFSTIVEDTLPVPPAASVRDTARAIARRVVRGGRPGLESSAADMIVHFGNGEDIPVLIEAMTRDTVSYSAAVVALVRLTGIGVDAMPNGVGTASSRLVAQKWWSDWYAQARVGFKAAERDDGNSAGYRMMDKLRNASR